MAEPLTHSGIGKEQMAAIALTPRLRSRCHVATSMQARVRSWPSVGRTPTTDDHVGSAAIGGTR